MKQTLTAVALLLILSMMAGCTDDWKVYAKYYTDAPICTYAHDGFSLTQDSCNKYQIGDKIKHH